MAGNTTDQRPRGPGRPFQKGQSGNPSGRPKVVLEIREMARQHGPRAIKAILQLAERSQDEKIQLAAWRELLDRGYGRAPQAITGEGGEGPAVIVVDTGIARDAASGPED